VSKQGKAMIKVCPACGYSFKNNGIKSRTEKIKCPMCGYEFIISKVPPGKSNDFDKRII